MILLDIHFHITNPPFISILVQLLGVVGTLSLAGVAFYQSLINRKHAKELEDNMNFNRRIKLVQVLPKYKLDVVKMPQGKRGVMLIRLKCEDSCDFDAASLEMPESLYDFVDDDEPFSIRQDLELRMDKSPGQLFWYLECAFWDGINENLSKGFTQFLKEHEHFDIWMNLYSSFSTGDEVWYSLRIRVYRDPDKQNELYCDKTVFYENYQTYMKGINEKSEQGNTEPW